VPSCTEGLGVREHADSEEIGRERVVAIQRSRMIRAMVYEVAERGAGSVTVAHVVARSGVSRRTFYEAFEDREECLLAALHEMVGLATARVESVAGAGLKWRERIRAGLTELLELFDAEPGIARFLVVESLAAGPEALSYRATILARLAAVVDEGRGEDKVGKQLSALVGEGVVGAALSVIHGRLIAQSPSPAIGSPRTVDTEQPRRTDRDSSEANSLLALLNPLMSMIVMPYLGPAAARRELKQPVPVLEHGACGNGAADPLHDLHMRLTYRTVRVLLAVASHPGASNRAIADLAGVADQGQISKLLTRLEGFGLVANGGDGGVSGAPNAWCLTPRGREAHSAIDRQAGNR